MVKHLSCFWNIPFNWKISKPFQVHLNTLLKLYFHSGTLSTFGNLFNVDQLLGGLEPPGQQRGQQTTGSSASAATVNTIIREALSLMDSANANDQRLNQPLTSLLGDVPLFGEDDEEKGGWRPDSNTHPLRLSAFSTFSFLPWLFGYVAVPSKRY